MQSQLPYHLLLLALSGIYTGHIQANTSLWQDIAQKNSHSMHTAHPAPQRLLRLDETRLQQLLNRRTVLPQPPISLEVPLPDGNNVHIELHDTTVLSKKLQQRYPTLKTWQISSQHPTILSGRAELTTLGLQIMLRSSSGDQWLIEPENKLLQPAALRHYRSYSKRQHSKQQAHTFSCGAQADLDSPMQWRRNALANKITSPADAQRSGKMTFSYDLAISATGEYTAQFGGSKEAAYSNIITTVNRINAIYEQELGITLKLVSGTETVFDDPATDPFNHTSLVSFDGQNQSVLDNFIGPSNYDVGHVLGSSAGGKGAAAVASVCRNGRKAQGYSASSSPASDHFMIDYVAHELAHQFGATHTFNSTHSGCGGNGGSGRVENTAFEPGSGSTILSYAGLCADDNIQKHADPQFHSGSIDQIDQLVSNGSAASCATRVNSNNNPPVVSAGKDYTIPARTPFTLNGSASDSDGDPLLYGWDQTDLGAKSRLGTDTVNNPLIKSNPLSSTGLRHIPDIPRLLATTQNTSNGESLPRSNRNMHFRLSVRDGKGANSSDAIKLTVHDTGMRFSIQSPSTALAAGSHQIRWRIADTDQPPINCHSVDIAYTNNQGVTFTDVKLNTPNDGVETIDLNQRTQHIRVKCSDNIFFALSSMTPHIATYQGDSSQTDDGTHNDTGTGISNNGGGGAIPLGLLVLGGLLTTLTRRKSSIQTAN